MKFHEVIKHLIPAKNENPLSRLYGFTKDQNGKMQIVEPEAKVIKEVITALANRKSESVDAIINDILQKFFMDGVRNRSGKNWTYQTLLGLCRPIYAGVVMSRHGIWRASKIYPPIISPALVKTALKRLKTSKTTFDSPRKVQQPRITGA